MPRPRRRVDCSFRVEEAKDVEQALDEWLTLAEEAGEADEAGVLRRVRRALGKLRRGIAYVTIDNPSASAEPGVLAFPRPAPDWGTVALPDDEEEPEPDAEG